MKNASLFKLSLRITHPSIDPHEISKALELQPDVVHQVGEPRKTPKGTPLEGVYSHSYWNCRLLEDKRLSNLIGSANNRLIDKLPFLTQLVDSGGCVEYFIGCFVSFNAGDLLDWKLLEQCALLKINLSFDIYGEAESS